MIFHQRARKISTQEGKEQASRDIREFMKTAGFAELSQRIVNRLATADNTLHAMTRETTDKALDSACEYRTIEWMEKQFTSIIEQGKEA